MTPSSASWLDVCWPRAASRSSGEAGSVARQVTSVECGAFDSDIGGDGRDRLWAVTRDDEHPHALRLEELDRLSCIGAQALAEYDEPERLVDLGGLLRVDPAASDAERDDAPARARLLPGDRLQLARREQLGRAEHVRRRAKLLRAPPSL